MPRKNGLKVLFGLQHEATECIHLHNILFISSVPLARQSPARSPTSDCGLKRPCLRLLGVRPAGTRCQMEEQWRFRCLLSSATEWWRGLEHNKMGKMGGGRGGSQICCSLHRRPSSPMADTRDTTIPSIARLTESPCYWPVGGGSSWTSSRRKRISITPHAMWGGDARYGHPRHADWKIAPDGGYAAEERAESSFRAPA